MFCSLCGKEAGINDRFCTNCGKELYTVEPTPMQPFPNTSPYDVATTGKRLLNFILDYFFALIFTVILMSVSFTVENQALFVITLIISHFIYYVFFESVWQKTPAKWITGTKVVMEDGSKPDLYHILGRTAARYIPFEAFSFIISPIGWHDSISRTMVVPIDYTPEMAKQVNTKIVRPKSLTVTIIIASVVAVGIIGLLASVTLVSLNTARAKSRDAKRVNDAKEIQNALDQYYLMYGVYPFELSDLSEDYLPNGLPTAPLPVDGTCTLDQNEYDYELISDDEYVFTFCLGSGIGEYTAGVNEVRSLPENNIYNSEILIR